MTKPLSDETLDMAFDVVRDALRRLNPQFHEHDNSWPSLDRIENEVHRLREENERYEEALRKIVGAGVVFDAKGTHSQRVVEAARQAIGEG